MLVIQTSNGLLYMGMRQVRMGLGNGVRRHTFQMALKKHTYHHLTLPASPDEAAALKQHAGYSPHSSCIGLVSVCSAQRALRSLHMLTPLMASGFELLRRHGVTMLTPAPLQPATTSSAQQAAVPATAAAAPAMEAAAAAAAAAGAGHAQPMLPGTAPMVELPPLNLTPRQLEKTRYGLKSVAPSLWKSATIVAQLQVSCHAGWQAVAAHACACLTCIKPGWYLRCRG